MVGLDYIHDTGLLAKHLLHNIAPPPQSSSVCFQQWIQLLYYWQGILNHYCTSSGGEVTVYYIYTGKAVIVSDTRTTGKEL